MPLLSVLSKDEEINNAFVVPATKAGSNHGTGIRASGGMT